MIMEKKTASIIIITTMVLSLVILGIVGLYSHFYKSVYFFKTTSSLEKSNFTIFHKKFDADTKKWLIGVVDEDNSMVGSFSCPKEPINNNPELYYKINDLSTLSGNKKVEYNFEHLINCVKVITLPALDNSLQVTL